MGDLKNPCRPTSFVLPPGSRFYPSEEQLICYYLTSKNDASNYYGIDVIQEIDLYNFDPFNLPESSCFRFGRGGWRRHWYYYVGRVLRERGRKRRAGCGYWKKRGRVRDVVSGDAEKVAVGTRKCFEFYLGDFDKNAVRTHWFMYEYALVDHQKDSFVVCRVLFRSYSVNHLSDHIFSSCVEETVATLRCADAQHDGTVIPSVVAKSNFYDTNSRDNDNEVSKLPSKVNIELENQTVGAPAFEQDLIAILEEDYIELDDLLCPLPGID